MHFWELIVEKPLDLNVLADLLEESQHPGSKTVRWLIEKKRWPKKLKQRYYWLELSEKAYVPYEVLDFTKNVLPTGMIPTAKGRAYYSSRTEAVWAVINAELYRGT